MLSDDSVHSDMESQMFKYSDRAPNTASQSVKESIIVPEKQESSFFVELVLKRTRHLKYNISMAFLSGLKIIATIAILVECPPAFPHCVNYWLYSIAAYDFINVISRFMLIKLLIPKKRKQTSKDGLPTDSFIPSEQSESIDDIRQRKVTLADEIRNPFQLQERKEDKAVQAVALTRFFYIGLLIWGNVVCYGYLYPVNQVLNLRTTLFYVFIAFGYLYLGVPLMIFLLDCFVSCFGDVKQWAIKKIIRRGDRSQSVGNIVIYRKYTVNLAGRHKCGICSGEYREDDNLIQLQCDIDHHFHERCLSKWMEKESYCPMCNRKIALRTNSGSGSEISPGNSVESIFL